MADLPETMTAIEIAEPGGPDVLRPVSRPLPRPGLGQVLIRTEAAGVNRGDIVQRMGFYPPPKGASDIPGLEVVGTIVAQGPGVSGWTMGERLGAIVPGGGYADYCLVDADTALPIPAGLSPAQAATLPETVMTVWTNVFERGRLQAGERVLIHGGSSGIGVSAIQMASSLGARVFTTAGSAEKCRICTELGAERAINYREEDFVAVVKELTDGAGVDVILDMVGGAYVERNLAALALEGRLVNIAFQQGSNVTLNLMPVMLKRLTLTGSTLRARSVEEKARIAEAVRKTIWPLVEAGRVRPILDSTFPLSQAGAAQARMESSQHVGKIVLLPEHGS